VNLRYRFLLFVAGLLSALTVPSARADHFQYTISFDPLNSTGLAAIVSFETASLLGSAIVSIDPSSVQIIASPRDGASLALARCYRLSAGPWQRALSPLRAVRRRLIVDLT
jgi:hypothetical protein